MEKYDSINIEFEILETYHSTTHSFFVNPFTSYINNTNEYLPFSVFVYIMMLKLNVL